MKFIDEAIITVHSGKGGKGCVSFRRERFIDRGGPDGGDGGRGGDILFKSSSQKRTLYQFRHKKTFRAGNGGHGQGKQKAGKSGSDLVIHIPPGTVISDAETGDVLHDFEASGETFIAAKGGRGGRGNKRFTTSTNRAPKFAQPGEPGESRTLALELKLIADAGIMGLPNAGKSTLISVISSARPKIADYPFTTLTPNLGVVKYGNGEPYTVADIPGLIEGAHNGAGLGITFLKHIERTRILVHVIDIAAADPDEPLAAYHTVNNELALYSEKLAGKPQVVVLNKLDMPGAEESAGRFRSSCNEKNILLISALTGKGINDLKSLLARMLEQEV